MGQDRETNDERMAFWKRLDISFFAQRCKKDQRKQIKTPTTSISSITGLVGSGVSIKIVDAVVDGGDN